VKIVLTHDGESFARRARTVLEGSLECNLLATILTNVLDGLHADASALFAYGEDDARAVRWAALRTPPYPMVASRWPGEAAPALVRQWLEKDPDLPGVNAPSDTARAIAGAWSAHTGGGADCRMRQGMHVLREVLDPTHPAPGALRVATAAERPLLTSWMRAFIEEAGLPGSDQARAMVDARIARQSLLVWDDGAPASMLGVGQAVAGTVRIGPVYTPPERRRRGYAGSAVAAASRRALAGGADACMLFTDLANPTSNKIYAAVGYARAGSWEQHTFTRM
jgi:FR47-like protein